MIYEPSWVIYAKANPVEQLLYYLANSWGDKGVLTFPKGVNLNLVAWQEFKLTYYDVVL